MEWQIIFDIPTPYHIYAFRPYSPLKVYISYYFPKYKSLETFYDRDLIRDMRRVANNHDTTNGEIILCDSFLEWALCVKAFHKSELKKWIRRQLVKPWELCEPFIPPLGALDRIVYPRVDPGIVPYSIYHRNPVVPWGYDILPDASGHVTTIFLRVLQTLGEVHPHKVRFGYNELGYLLGRYITVNQCRLIDYRDTSIVHCEGDMLGHAFQVRTFHRRQGMALIRNQLIK